MIAVHLEDGQVSVREVLPADLPEGHARIKLLLGGICNTDLELQRGYYGFSGTPGHEFVGEVIEGPREWLGKRVVGEINLACGHCSMCSAGLGRHCKTRTVLGIIQHPGAFAESLTLPAANLRAVPDEVSTEHAVFTEPLAAACEILEQVAIPPGTAAAVLGDGKLGLLIAQVLHSHGAQVHHFGKHPEKLAISSALGITTSPVQGILPADEFALVVDATGSATGLNDALRMVQPRGTIVMKSTVNSDVPLNVAAAIVNEIKLVGSRCGLFEPALELLRNGAVHITPLIDSRYPLHNAAEAFRRAAEPSVLKVLLG